ncbi:MAG: hypothetical protein R6X20_11885 [Phycisphaerae bacterium]
MSKGMVISACALFWALTWLPACAALGGAASAASPGEAEGVAFLPLTVTSEEEGLGKKVHDMLRAKAKRLGAVVYDPHSVRDVLAGRTVSLRTPPADLARLAREAFRADVAVVGHVAGREPYTVDLLAVYADAPGPPGVFRRTYRAANHHEIPVEMARAVYDILGLPHPNDPLRMLRQDPEIARRWASAPNLVANPGFEQADSGGSGPAHWQKVEPQMAWTANPDGPGKVLRYEMDTETAATYGLDFYSDWIPIQAGATYRFACRYKTLGPTPKIFLKGYHAFPARNGYPAQRRETYRRQVHPKGARGEWHTVTADFIPSATRPEHTPTFLKVDLYAYWPAGVIYWDDVVLKKVRDAPPSNAEPSAGAAMTQVPRFACQTVLHVWPGRSCPAGRAPIEKQSVTPGAARAAP